jgi:hypothetical protein
MTPLELIQSKRTHAARLANQRGAAGEQASLADMAHWVPRPSGAALKVLLEELRAAGKTIKRSSFDALHIPNNEGLNFLDSEAVRLALPTIDFIEIKTASQARVKPGFAGFFFALTESEIAAAEALGPRHRVALYNKATGELYLTSVPEILERAKSSTWQLSVQL